MKKSFITFCVLVFGFCVGFGPLWYLGWCLSIRFQIAYSPKFRLAKSWEEAVPYMEKAAEMALLLGICGGVVGSVIAWMVLSNIRNAKHNTSEEAFAHP